MKRIGLDRLSTRQKRRALLCLEARKNAYAPYSHFKVGALVVSISGVCYPGCNVESADYTLTSHAEMTAINNMIASGERVWEEMYVALESLPGGEPVPCGLCRQKMLEFASPSHTIYCLGLTAGKIKSIYKTSLSELLPHPFTKRNFTKD
jgi:cytidine deaminase